jgi:hypothetical protein
VSAVANAVSSGGNSFRAGVVKFSLAPKVYGKPGSKQRDHEEPLQRTHGEHTIDAADVC